MLLLACTAGDRNAPPDILEDTEPPMKYVRRTVRACAVIDKDSLSFPHRLVFLYKTPKSGVDAQAELFAPDWGSRLRCGEVHVHLAEGSDGTPVTMDFMPPASAVKLEELRVYRDQDDWTADDPYAVALTSDHDRFVFTAKLTSPAGDDRSAILLP
jgi:hypothetical protein